jgi:hypothetical protein
MPAAISEKLNIEHTKLLRSVLNVRVREAFRILI